MQTAILVVTTVFAGLMAGLFASFAYSVMPGLGRSSDRTMVEAMQDINKAILNPLFMLLFLGAIPLLAASVWVAWRGDGRDALPWSIAALALYLAVFGVTMAVNVPLNDALVGAGAVDDIKDLASVRGAFENQWVRWNVIRTVLATASFGCTTWALVVYARKTGA